MFTARRCPRLESTSTFSISHSAEDPVFGTTATYSCLEGTIEGENTSTCLCNGSWSVINPECTTSPSPSPSSSSTPGGREGDDGKTQFQCSPT